MARNDSNPANLTDVDGVLYFSANNGSDGFEPYRSNGQLGGTSQVANVNPGNDSSHPSGFMSAGTNVYFAANHDVSGRELWTTDGTAGVATIVQDLQSGLNSSNPEPLGELEGDRLILAATGSGLSDRELWITGGPISGLLLVEDMNPGEFFGSDPSDLVQFGTDRLFVADDGLAGRELYRLEELRPRWNWS